MRSKATFGVSIILLALCALPAPTQDKPKIRAWQLPPVTLKKVNAEAESVVVEMTLVQNVTVATQVKVKKVVDGVEKEVEEMRLNTESRPVTRQITHSIKSARVLSGEGKELIGAARTEVLKEGMTIIYGDGDDVDPGWFQCLKPDAVVLLVPRLLYEAPPVRPRHIPEKPTVKPPS